MNRQEKQIYETELKLIDLHFKGLRPRPVEIIDDADFFGQADEPNLKINRSMLRKPPREMEDLLKHELIHYFLKDEGKEYHGHGKAFLKMSNRLGIAGRYELMRCHSSEELESMQRDNPTNRRLVKTPLPAVESEINALLKRLLEQVEKLTGRQRLPLYQDLNSLLVMFTCYAQAVNHGEKFVIEERITKRPGPKGKKLSELRDEHVRLHAQMEEMKKTHGWPRLLGDPRLKKTFMSLQEKATRIFAIVEDRYGFTL